MKKSIGKLIITSAVLAAAVFTSCETTGNVNATTEKKSESGTASETTENNTGKEEIPVDEFAQFRKEMEDFEITVTAVPKETVKNRDFASPYRIKAASSEGVPYAGFAIDVSYPSSRDAGLLMFSKTQIVTDENGQAEFMPGKPVFAVKSQVTFTPACPDAEPELVQKCSQSSKEAVWKVKTNAPKGTGILISINDYNKSGKMTLGSNLSSSSKLLGELWRAGYTSSGNADFHNEVDGGNPESVRQAARKIAQGNILYVVYGKVKYASDITKDENGFYTLTLNGEIGCIKIASGEIMTDTSKTVTVKAKDQWSLYESALNEMARQFCDELLYSI